MADDQTFHDDVEAYCTRLSHRPGDTVGLCVSTRSDRLDVRVERWGGTREIVWAASDVPGSFVAPPPDADSAGCEWPVSVEIPIDERWRSGFHLVTLTAHGAPAGRDVGHAGFVVRGAAEPPTERVLLVLATNTWNAYNTWGGKSLYTGGDRVSFGRPFGRGMLSRPEVDRDDRKARPVRWGEEPDTDGLIFQRYRTDHAYPSAIGSAGWFTHERRFVEWAERAGYTFDYAVSSDLDDDPSALDGYDLVVSVGHDEYWSAPQRHTLAAHLERGGNFASFSGNTMFWQVRLERAEPTGTGRSTRTSAAPTTNMVCHKYSAHVDDPVVGTDRAGEMTGMWADPVVGQPEWRLLGAGSAFGLYHRFGRATARGVGGFIVNRDDHWMFDGTGLRYGDVLGAEHGVVGYETVGCPITFDELHLPVPARRDGLPGADLPDDIEIVAFTPSSNLGVGEYPKSIAALSDQGDLEFVTERLYGETSDDNLGRVRRGNAVMLTCRPYGPTGGGVATIGTTDWVFGLDRDQAVGRVTANVLDHFLD